MSTTRRVGLIVNPVAGMGGRVGLKGTDGQETLERALNLGATPLSPERATVALKTLAESASEQFELLVAPGAMGEKVAQACQLDHNVIGTVTEHRTRAADTEIVAREMLNYGVDLLMFAGGDGTARNIYNAVGTALPVVGIPTGVKMHSAVHARNPRSAGLLAAHFIDAADAQTEELEVMDIDEDAFRRGTVSAKLYGYLRVPVGRGLLQGLKVGSTDSDEAVLGAIAEEVVGMMQADAYYLIGPGTTTRAIADRLAVQKTLLGVDVIKDGELLASDAPESDLLDFVQQGPAFIIVTPIGGQGFIFGRGNQQLSHRVIEQVGAGNILVVATPAKLASLDGNPLLVDTGDPEVDQQIAGYRRVITGYRSETVYETSA